MNHPFCLPRGRAAGSIDNAIDNKVVASVINGMKSEHFDGEQDFLTSSTLRYNCASGLPCSD